MAGLLQGERFLSVEAEPQGDDSALLLRETEQGAAHQRPFLPAKKELLRIGPRIGGEPVRERPSLPKSRRFLQRGVGSPDDLKALHGARREAGLPGDFPSIGPARKPLRELARRPLDDPEVPEKMVGNPYQRRMAVERAAHRLADPPDRPADEAHPAIGIEAAGRLDEAEIAFADQILERKAAVAVLFRHAHHEEEM
jgi:hypothetical protein